MMINAKVRLYMQMKCGWVEAIANVIGNSADYIKNIHDGKVYITAGCDERKVVIRIEIMGKD